jgi:hypothetical protein
MIPFISNSDYIVATGMQFPVKEVLGIITYPFRTSDTLIYLSSVELMRKLEINKSVIKFIFSDSSSEPVLCCTITGFTGYPTPQDNPKDVLFLLMDPVIEAPCGHMVTTPAFCDWLRTAVRSVDKIESGALQINPTYVYSQNISGVNTIKVDGTEVSSLDFNNLIIRDSGECNILGKVKTELPKVTPERMTALQIKDQNGNSTLLKGESIGFSITPAPKKSEDDKVFCRTHITTTTSEIIFTDQGTGL